MSTSMSKRRTKPAAEQDLLDDQQQEELIATLEREAKRQAGRNRRLVLIAGAGLASLYAIFAALQIFFPWKMYHQAVFKGMMSPASVVVGELGAVATVAIATTAAVSFGPGSDDSWRKMLTLSVTMAALEAFFWGTALFKLVGQSGVESVVLLGAAWRPIAPAAWVTFVIAIINGLDRLGPQFAALRAAQYQLKHA